MEELKDVRDEVKDRPSTHQVEHMVGKIEKTFKSYVLAYVVCDDSKLTHSSLVNDDVTGIWVRM
jgi:hypothetical protein